MAVQLCKPFLKRYHPDSHMTSPLLKKNRSSARYCFQALPIELCQEIFEYLTLQELLHVMVVSRQFLGQSRMKIEHHASRALFSVDRIKDVSLKELTGYIEAIGYLITYLSQDPRQLRKGLLKKVLCWNQTTVDIRGTLQQFQIPMPERDYWIILRMATERFTVVDRDHHFIHGAKSLPSENRLTKALGVFFQFVEMIKSDSCLTEKMSHNLQIARSIALAIPSQKAFRAGILQRLTVYVDPLKG